MRSSTAFLGCLLSACTAIGQGYPIVDLTLSDNGKGQIEMRLRTDGYFDEVPSSMTFTVRWPASAGIALDTAVRCYPFQDVLPMNAVLPEEADGWMYRTFNGFGTSLLSDFGLAWNMGREYPICTADILVPGTTFELVQNDWTYANNRDYYVSLGGYDRTGGFFPSPAPDVDIRSENPGTGNLDIMLTPEDDFYGWVTDLSFTVRWPAGSGVSLGIPLQNEETAEYLPIEKVGGEVTTGGFTYQKFHGEGVKSIANSDDAWHQGQEVIVLSVPLFGDPQDILVTNDAWTAANEGDYLIELNSIGHEGAIEDMTLAAPVIENDRISATVLAVANGFNVSLELPGSARTTTFNLHNAAGQAVWSTTREGAHGRLSLTAETGPLPDGMYILSVHHGERSLTKRVVR